MNKAKIVALESGDFKSADSETILERLKNMCGIELTQEDLKDLGQLRKKRNKTEHFNVDENLLPIENLINKSITIIIELIVEHYDLDEITDEERELLSQIKVLLRQSQRHYDTAKAIAQKELLQTGMMNYAATCPECKEEFLLRDVDVRCIFCGYKASGDEAANNYIFNVLNISDYETIKGGGELPLYECPACGNETFVFNSEIGMAICFSCDYKDDLAKFQYFNRCGRPFVDSDDETAICPVCM